METAWVSFTKSKDPQAKVEIMIWKRFEVEVETGHIVYVSCSSLQTYGCIRFCSPSDSSGFNDLAFFVSGGKDGLILRSKFWKLLTFQHVDKSSTLGTSARWRQGSVLPFPQRSQRSQQKRIFRLKRPSSNHTKLTNWSLVDDLNLKKIPFRQNKKYFCDPCDMRFLTKVAHQTKHAAVAKEFEYPYASPLDELRAVDKALWVFLISEFFNRISIYIYRERERAAW